MPKVVALSNGALVEVDAASSVPLRVETGLVLMVQANTQVLFTEEIDLEGDLDLDGILVEVN